MPRRSKYNSYYNPYYNQDRMTLNTAGYTPAVFNPIEFKPVEADYGILERAMAKQEERKQKAIQQQTIVKQALGKVREQLHQDEETDNWFNNYVSNIENNINAATEVGDYANALNVATQEAGNILNDAEVTGRIRSNQEYNEELKVQQARRERGDISQDTYDWWVKENPYKFNPTLDNNGKVIGAQKYEPTFRPENDLKWENVYVLAKQMLSPEKGSSGSSSNVDRNGVIGRITSGGSYQYERIRPEDITATVGKIIGNNWKALKQDFEVKLYQLEKLKGEYESLPVGSQERALKEQQYNNMQLLTTGANGVQLTNDVNGWTTYYTRMVADGLYSEGLGYDWRFTESNKIGRLDESGSGGSGNSTTTTKAPFVNWWTMQGGYNDMPTDLSSNINQANNIGNDAINAIK